MKLYINRKDPISREKETVDEANSRESANYLVGEYNLADRYGIYYVSSRCCKNWK